MPGPPTLGLNIDWYFGIQYYYSLTVIHVAF